MHQCMLRENRNGRIFYICEVRDYENWAVATVIGQLAKAHLVVENVVSCSHQFDKDSLLDVFGEAGDLVLIGRCTLSYW